ncbi:response regulator [Aquincola sp. S2]|uniref:Response regulator n=1 Tax=Pseudaquabacterium terrae TaxID=2732868 RepID=A0ABX2ET65_9BURK|nr:response regulator [Aquabacterium terrae]NRF71833.1 response regulator [Aquabacterium terrae]
MAKDDVRVVVVDDEPDAAEALQTLLELDGYNVKVAHDAREAFATIAAHTPHCVLLDLGLPEMDGCELARRLRERYGPELTLLAVTGWARQEDREQAELAGVDYVLLKPVQPEMLSRFFPRVE